MANKDKLQEISTKVDDVAANQANHWKALNTIAERLGISLTDEGAFFMESDGSNVPLLGLQSGGQAVAAAAPAQTMDLDTVAAAVHDKFKNDPPPVSLGKHSFSIDIMSIVKANQGLFETVTKPWSDWGKKHRKDMLKLHGYKEVTVGDDTILAVDDNPMIPPREDYSVGTTQLSQEPKVKQSKLASFRHRLWLDFVGGYWKTSAYFVALLGFGFGVCMWWDSKSKIHELDTEVQIMRTIFNSDSAGQDIVKVMDYNINRYGRDKVLEMYRERSNRIQRERVFGKRK